MTECNLKGMNEKCKHMEVVDTPGFCKINPRSCRTCDRNCVNSVRFGLLESVECYVKNYMDIFFFLR